MKLVFISNYMNHHQLPMAQELYQQLGEDYRFIQIEPMEEERIKMGWAEDFMLLPFLQLYYKEPMHCQRLIDDADIVVLGNEKNPSFISARLERKTPILRYTERIYKNGQWKFISPKGLLNKYKEHTKYRKNPFYLLCAGAYVASDFSLIHAYIGKRYTWGYFPETVFYEEEKLFEKKIHEKTKLLWAGRFIDWKHPEYAVELAYKLKQQGFDFELTMIGDGDLRTSLEEKIKRYGLINQVILTGYRKPNEVRSMMEKANIYLFTSDYKEGWGAVLNEAMNAGCAVVANCAIGSVPSLIKPGLNGFIYKNGDFNEFEKIVCLLINNQGMQRKVGKEAYTTIVKEWNHKNATKRLLELCTKIIGDKPDFYKSGPLSQAKAIKPRNMYKYMKRK